jgi:hypothetical protein
VENRIPVDELKELLKQIWQSSSNPCLRAGALSFLVFWGILALIDLVGGIGYSEEVTRHRGKLVIGAVIIAVIAGLGSLLSVWVWIIAAVIAVIAIAGSLLWRWSLFRQICETAFWKVYENWQLALGLLLLLIVAYGAFDLTKSFRFIALVLGIILATALLTRYSLQIHSVKALGAARQPPVPSEYGELLEKIDFDYGDSPGTHGWQLNGTEPTFRSVHHPNFGRALKIMPSRNYQLNYSVTDESRYGTRIEFAAEISDNWLVGVKLNLKRETGSPSSNKRLSIKHGSEFPEHIGGNEWRICVEPICTVGKWGIYRIDLEEAVGKTFAEDREKWSYESLVGFYLCHKLCLAYISIFKSRNGEDHA